MKKNKNKRVHLFKNRVFIKIEKKINKKNKIKYCCVFIFIRLLLLVSRAVS